jgi:hypothetical protein
MILSRVVTDKRRLQSSLYIYDARQASIGQQTGAVRLSLERSSDCRIVAQSYEFCDVDRFEQSRAPPSAKTRPLGRLNTYLCPRTDSKIPLMVK